LETLEGEAFIIESEMSGDWRNWDHRGVETGAYVVTAKLVPNLVFQSEYY